MITSVYPVLAVADVAATARFFREQFGFETVFEVEWYVSLRAGDFELAVLDADHETIPAAHRGRRAGGVLVNVEVDDVDAVAERLEASGVPVALPLRSEAFGQRHIIVVAPGDVLVDVIQPIPFTGVFASD